MAAIPLIIPALTTDDGTPVSGALIVFKKKGTATNQVAYLDEGLTIPSQNPEPCDAGGRQVAYLDGSLSYDIAVKSADLATTYLSATFSANANTVTFGDGWIEAITQPVEGGLAPYTAVYLQVYVGTDATAEQQTANTTLVNAALTSPRVRVVLPPGYILFNSAWLVKADNVIVSGSGENVTYCRFTHSGDCITVGAPGFDANQFVVEDLTPEQASGTGYFLHHRKGRKVTIRRCGGQALAGDLLRKFVKLGSASVAVTNVTNNGSGACRIAAAGHGYTSNDYVLVNRVTGATGANGLFRVTVIDANTFDLNGSTFGGAYVSGGATCPYAAFCILEDMSEVDVSLDGVDIYSYAGEVRLNNIVVSGNNFTASVPTTGSRGLKIHSGNAFDRFDGIYGRGVYGFIQFDINVMFDNTRVTNVQLLNMGLDLFKTNAFLCKQDNCDDTGGGMEAFNLNAARAATPYAGGSTAFYFDATDADIHQGTMLGVSAESYEAPIRLVGDSSSATIVAELTMSLFGICRAASGTHDFLNITGGMRNVNIQSVTAAAVNAANTRSGVRLETTVPPASVTIGPVNVYNFTGPEVQDAGGGAQTVGTGLVGTRTSDSAVAGRIGEYVSSTVLVGAKVSLTTDVAANVTSISLTAGDWDVEGNILFDPTGGNTTLQIQGSGSATSATQATRPNGGGNVISATITNPYGLPIVRHRVSVAVTTTYYLVATANHSGGALGAFGFIGARRVR